ncbi:hypothetical protein GVX82_02635 [Patescibacteria group bacterium]|jgi:hypothetical protein|nr:hypothetical protein [Patescibacteria group bacterium]
MSNRDGGVTAKDFVLYAGLMIALYWSAISLVTLWFQYIDRLFPDDLDTYVDPFSGAIRFAMASLIILTPVFLGLAFAINREMRWLLYITLLIAGIAVVADLIALVNVFLSGETTVRFLLKVLTVFIIAGGGFAYYLFDIRGYWIEHERLSKGIAAGVGAVVLASIVAGFFIVGTPADQRALRLDQERVSDLAQIQRGVVDYWQDTGELPESLTAIEDPLTEFAELPDDPDTDEPYPYRRLGQLRFELCATFDRPSPSTRRARYGNPGVQESSWQHPAGEHCFTRTIDPERLAPPERGIRPMPVG